MNWLQGCLWQPYSLPYSPSATGRRCHDLPDPYSLHFLQLFFSFLRLGLFLGYSEEEGSKLLLRPIHSAFILRLLYLTPPSQLTLLNLRSLMLNLTPFCWLHSTTVIPYSRRKHFWFRTSRLKTFWGTQLGRKTRVGCTPIHMTSYPTNRQLNRHCCYKLNSRNTLWRTTPPPWFFPLKDQPVKQSEWVFLREESGSAHRQFLIDQALCATPGSLACRKTVQHTRHLHYEQAYGRNTRVTAHPLTVRTPTLIWTISLLRIPLIQRNKHKFWLKLTGTPKLHSCIILGGSQVHSSVAAISRYLLRT